jgi:hypothetical protein
VASEYEKRRQKIAKEPDSGKRQKALITMHDEIIAEAEKALTKVEQLRQQGFKAIEQKYGPSKRGRLQ